ncbi:MAG: hypothetical protein PVG20_10300, partial [Thioalkalispiraceae bacterium]
MFKTNPPSKRIARRLIVAIVLFSTLITLLTSAYQLYGYYKRDMNTIHSHLHEIETVYLSSIAAQVWVADQDEMRVLLQGVLNIPNIVYIEVIEEGRTWLQTGKMQTNNKIERNFPIYYSHRGQKLHIGDLYVQATLENVYQNLYDQAVTI